jgi:hypothetical protein
MDSDELDIENTSSDIILIKQHFISSNAVFMSIPPNEQEMEISTTYLGNTPQRSHETHHLRGDR